ncbi:MAG: hypothetical protein EXR27_17745 [Betaproteobacteria bacterium]|nr:hypothetical protein [Betaproteobacteria bacterium]
MREHMHKHMRARLILAVVLVCGLAACGKSNKENPFAPGTAMYQHFEDITAKVKAHPKLDAEIKQAKNRYQAMTIGGTLVKKGMSKLDDASLVRLARLIPELLDGMSPQSCGALVRGKTSSSSGKGPEREFLESLGKGDPEKGRSYLDLVYLALATAVDDPFTPSPPHPVELRAAFQNLLGGRFTEQQRKDIIDTLTAGKRAKDEDTCWAVKALYANIGVTPTQHRRVILRYLASVEI